MKPGLHWLRNERGIALVTALMLTLISLTIVLAVLYLVTQGTRLSASQKRYQSSLEASYGGVEFFSKELLPKLIAPAVNNELTATLLNDIKGDYTSLSGLDLQMPSGNQCLREKLSLPFASWSSCGATSKTSEPKEAPDVTFTLKGAGGVTGYDVYAKIIDTQAGNTNTSGVELVTGGVVQGLEGVISPGSHYPYLYTMEVQGESESNQEEKARLSVLYAY